ncbi:MAG: hypothetical protein IT227_00760 [Flavobacteriales bacterium]|nr:hypothetical protein [Flavobacteriales bacterium]
MSILLLFAPFVSAAQDPVGFFVTQDADTVWMYPSPKPIYQAVSISTDIVLYYQKGKKSETQIAQRKIKELHFDGHKWVNMPIASLGMDRLHEVHLENERYVLTDYLDGFLYLFVLDKTTNEFVVKKEKHSTTEKEDRALLERVVRTYFADCPEGIAAVEKGIEYSYKKDVYEVERSNRGWQRLFREANAIHCP